MKNFLNKLGGAITGRKGIGTTITVIIIAAVVLFNVLIYTLTSAFKLYIHKPEEEDFSISGNTDPLFAKAEQFTNGKKVRIIFCYTEDALKTHDTGAFVLETAYAFRDRYPDLIELKFVNMLTMLDEDLKYFDFEKYKAYGTINSSSVIFEYGEGSEYNCQILTDVYTGVGFVDFYTLDSSFNIVAYNGEEIMASMIAWVLADEHPTVYITEGHGETADIAFSKLLTCAGYKTESINLRRQEIPASAGMLLILNPTSDFDKGIEGTNARGETDKIEEFLEAGGKLYTVLDPYVKELPNIEGVLAKYGISLSSDAEDRGVRDIVRDVSNAITSDGYTFVATHADGEIPTMIYDNISKYGQDRVLLSTVGSLLTDESLGAHPLLVSGGASSTYRGGERTDSEGSYTVAAYSTRQCDNGKTATVLVVPSAYITASEAMVSEGYSNKDFVYSAFSVLFDSSCAPYGCNTVIYNNQLLENFTMGRARAYTAMIMAVPVILAVLGTVIIVRRKNK